MPRHNLALPVAVSLTLLATACAAATDSPAPAVKVTVSSTGPTTARVSVEVNHCFVEPVAFDGQVWNVPFDRQFGWGGLQPENWKGHGVMTRVSEDRARFEDDGGSTVAFRPADDPSVRPVEKALCS